MCITVKGQSRCDSILSMRFKDKIVLVTGASNGIGAETARLFGAEGATVIVNYHDDKASAEKVLKDCGGKGMVIQADVSKEDEVQRMFDTVSKKYGSLDILVNNAGIVKSTPFNELSLDQWNRTHAINLTGVFLCCKTALPLMKKGSSICNISSIRGLFDYGRPPIADYSSSKAGVISFTKTLAKAVAPDIRVNAVAPGMTNTANAKRLPKEAVEQFKKDIYLKRLIEPKEVANAVLFLCSDEASAITGVNLMVDGGQSLKE